MTLSDHPSIGWAENPKPQPDPPQLDLETIHARWCEGGWSLATPDVRALVAEVRRLREQAARVDAFFAAVQIRDDPAGVVECCWSGSCEVCRR